jgi:hypothetical protein
MVSEYVQSQFMSMCAWPTTWMVSLEDSDLALFSFKSFPEAKENEGKQNVNR